MGNCILKYKENEIIEDTMMDDTLCGINTSIKSNYSSSNNCTTSNKSYIDNKQ